MKANMLVGLVVLIVGVALLIVGINASNSVADQLSNTFLGRFTQATTWYIIGGIGVSLLGGVMMFLGAGGKKLS
ncbi:MAG: DUF3185 family protein [Phycisphaerales bacterium]